MIPELEKPKQLTRGELFISHLRAATGASHKALEQLPLSLNLTADHVDRDAYVRYLEIMYPVIRSVERFVFRAVSDVLPDLSQRAKLHLLKADLDVLGGTAETATVPGFDAAMSHAYAMGIMYVIEGSTLGGRVILKSVQPALAFGDLRGCNYFAGYGAATGPLWKGFLMQLMVYASKHNADNEIVAGANHAFSTIFELLKKG
ncbi:MAG: biliverdin-producing heme oxygenase [Bacteroidota bacterium]